MYAIGQHHSTQLKTLRLPLQRVREPLDIADGGRVHVWDRLAEQNVASVTRAVDGSAVPAHPSRQQHLIIFQSFVPQAG